MNKKESFKSRRIVEEEYNELFSAQEEYREAKDWYDKAKIRYDKIKKKLEL